MTFDIQESRRICEAATRGPWIVRKGAVSGSTISISTEDDPVLCERFPAEKGFGGSFHRHEICSTWCVTPANVDFITHARTALPEACDVIEAAAAREAELREQMVDATRALGYDDDALERCELEELIRDALAGTRRQAAGREAELTSKYERLRDAINGSVPRDLEYMASLEKEVERLRAENAELCKRPAGLSDAAIGAACAFETARRMDEAEAAEAAGGEK